MEKTQKTLDELVAETQRRRKSLDEARFLLGRGEMPYSEALTYARSFATSFDEYHRAKWGRGKRIEPKSLLR